MRLHYTGGDIDRVSVERLDPAWVRRKAAEPAALVVPVLEDQNLFACEPDVDTPGSPAVPRLGELVQLCSTSPEELVLLGLRRGCPVFAVDVEQSAGDVLAHSLDARFADLRRAAGLLADADAAMLAYARGLLHWHRTHRHCGQCGRQCVSEHGGHMRRCESCRTESFPRIDPAVIMLVEARSDGRPVCLLGRHARLPPGMYSTLAGFVEPGESLEEAVIREVQEESGVHVAEVAYRGSQPWPFPSALMIGFRATARTLDIEALDAELEDVRWFDVETVARFGEWDDGVSALRYPRRDSIARALIDEWLDQRR